MAFKVAAFLEMLSDGKWHGLEEVRKKTRLSVEQVGQIAEFLEQYGFVTVDAAEKRIRIREAVKRFLTGRATS
jgi:DNA-binding IclR family transcriptional regulator